MDYTMFSQFLTFYPTGCLISDLLQIYQGKFVVRASVQVNGVTRATGLALAETLSLAEDRARSRALMVLLPDGSYSVQPELPARYPSVMTEAQAVVKPSLPDFGTDNKQPSSNAPPSAWISSTISSVPEVPAVDSSTFIPYSLPPLAVENYGAPGAADVTQSSDAEVGGDFLVRMYDSGLESDEEVLIPFGDEEPGDSYDYSHESDIPAKRASATRRGE